MGRSAVCLWSKSRRWCYPGRSGGWRTYGVGILKAFLFSDCTVVAKKKKIKARNMRYGFCRRTVLPYDRGLSSTSSVAVVDCCIRLNWIRYVFCGLPKYWSWSFETLNPKMKTCARCHVTLFRCYAYSYTVKTESSLEHTRLSLAYRHVYTEVVTNGIRIWKDWEVFLRGYDSVICWRIFCM